MNSSEVARLRIQNSGLAGRSFESAAEAVGWLGAMQAQDYGPAKWSIGQRSMDLLDKDIDLAVDYGSIVRTHVLRPTWHFAARDDIRWLLALTAPRIQRQNERRYRELGLDHKTRARCESLIVSALEGENHLTREGIAAVLKGAGIDHSGQRLPYILLHCELKAAICSGKRAGRHHTYASFDERVPGSTINADEALVELVIRYLRSHGPATVADLRWWSSLPVSDINRALNLLGSAVESKKVEDLVFWSVAGDEEDASKPQGSPSIRLLQAYDELIVGYTTSRFFGDPQGPAARAAWRDRRLPSGLILMKERILGHWRRSVQKDVVRVEAYLYQDLKVSAERALKTAAAELGRFLGHRATLEIAPVVRRHS